MDSNCGHVWAESVTSSHSKPPHPQGDSSPAWLEASLHPAVLIESRNKERIHFPNYSKLGLLGNSCTSRTKATPQQRKETGDEGPVRKTDRQRSDLDGGDCWRTPAGYCGIRSIQLNVKMWGRGAQEMECATNYSHPDHCHWALTSVETGASRSLCFQAWSAVRTACFSQMVCEATSSSTTVKLLGTFIYIAIYR